MPSTQEALVCSAFAYLPCLHIICLVPDTLPHLVYIVPCAFACIPLQTVCTYLFTCNILPCTATPAPACLDMPHFTLPYMPCIDFLIYMFPGMDEHLHNSLNTLPLLPSPCVCSPSLPECC